METASTTSLVSASDLRPAVLQDLQDELDLREAELEKEERANLRLRALSPEQALQALQQRLTVPRVLGQPLEGRCRDAARCKQAIDLRIHIHYRLRPRGAIIIAGQATRGRQRRSGRPRRRGRMRAGGGV